MNKIIISGIVVLVLAGIGAAYAVQKSSHDMMMTKEQKMQDSISIEKIDTGETMKQNQAKDAMMARSGDASPKGADVMTAHDTSQAMTQNSGSLKAGSYEVYSPEKIVSKAAGGKVVLFFHASWCPTCRALDADIKAHLDTIPEHLTILDVDYDAYTDLKIKYGVTIQHTLVEVDAQGNLVKKWSGSPTLAALTAEVK